MKKNVIVAILILVITGIAFGVYEVLYLQKAHSTFENYYAFRGCTQLIEKTDTFGTCKLTSGQTVKIVKFDNRWFLDGDLPCGFLCF